MYGYSPIPKICDSCFDLLRRVLVFLQQIGDSHAGLSLPERCPQYIVRANLYSNCIAWHLLRRLSELYAAAIAMDLQATQ